MYCHKIEQKIDALLLHIQDLKNYQCKAMFNVQEAAFYLGISKSTLYKHTSAHTITYYKPKGKLIRFRKEDLDGWLQVSRIASNKELTS